MTTGGGGGGGGGGCIYSITTADMLHGRNNENLLHQNEHFPPIAKILLFLPCNMSAVQNLFNFFCILYMLTTLGGQISSLSLRGFELNTCKVKCVAYKGSTSNFHDI